MIKKLITITMIILFTTALVGCSSNNEIEEELSYDNGITLWCKNILSYDRDSPAYIKQIEEAYDINISDKDQIIKFNTTLHPLEGVITKQTNDNTLKGVNDLYYTTEVLKYPRDYSFTLYQYNENTNEYTIIRPGENFKETS